MCLREFRTASGVLIWLMRNIQLTGNGAFIASGGIGPAEFQPRRGPTLREIHANSTRGAGKYVAAIYVSVIRPDNPSSKISWYIHFRDRDTTKLRA